MSAGKCACGRGMVGQTAWAKATAEQRKAWLAQGLTLLQGRGMCRGCYLRAWRRGEIPPRTRVRSGRPCQRCGIPATKDLCRDCSEVTAPAGVA